MKVIGLDLAGPANTQDTCLAVFQAEGSGLNLMEAIHRVEDQQILQTVSRTGRSEMVVVGIDAPLSYQPGGGDRDSDAELRRRVLQRSRGVGILTPTMTRMVYLTLRGISLTRMLETLKPDLDLRIVEVHPGACLVLRGAVIEDVTGFKRNRPARLRLLDWLETQNLQQLPKDGDITDHFVAACAAALGAWQWSLGRPVWIHPASPPIHPYDFAC